MELDTTIESDDSNFDYLKKIEETYIVKLIGGRHTTKGSFWARNDSYNEFYINPTLVENNPDKIHDLYLKKKKCWALVQKVVWGGKWKDQPVEEVMMLDSDQTSCENFKKDLKLEYELSIRKHRKFSKRLELLENGKWAEEKLVENEYNQLQEQLMIIKEKLNKYKGWSNIP